MGAGVYLGRIGGLAAALGIGAAVFIGQGVASAEPATGSGAASSSSTNSSPSDHKETEARAGDSGETETHTADPAPRKKKKPKDSQVSSSSAHETGSKEAVTARPERVTEPKNKVGEAKNDEATSDEATSDEATSEEAPVATAAGAPGDPAAKSSVAVSVMNPSTPQADSAVGDTPPKPADSPAALVLMAAARRESFGKAAVADPVVTPPTNSLAIDPGNYRVDTDVDTPGGPRPGVIAIPQIPPLAFLQQIPVIGPMFVTPIVAFIHQIPLISDILHPLIGFPIPYGLPPGTPVPRDVKVVSFDSTQIYVHIMPAYGLPANKQAPTILYGAGLGQPGPTNLDGAQDAFLGNDIIGIAPLRQAGYNVVTWDPRGEWNSGGQLEVDSPDFEGRDVSAIISWLATQPEVKLDTDGDPRIGMVGGSYGGGVQLVTAANDPRVDAIVPTIAWHSLNTSLYKAGAFKTGWGTLLTTALVLTGARPNPALYPAAIWGALTGMVSPADQQLLDDRGPDELVAEIKAPTLLIQGTVDTLFTLAEADLNAKALIAQGVPTKVVWFCGGHGSCVSSFDNGEVVKRATLDWLNRYVKGDPTVNTGPQFEWVDQRGQNFSTKTYPVPQGAPLTTSGGAGVLPLLPLIGASGPEPFILATGPIGTLLGLPSASKAFNALNLTTAKATTTQYIVGAPQLSLTYSGTGTARHVYAQLVDDTTGLVLGNLVTPVPVTLDGQQHTIDIPMEMVAHTLAPGETVTLQLVSSAVPYENILSLGVLNVSSINLSLPTANAALISTPTSTQVTVAAA